MAFRVKVENDTKVNSVNVIGSLSRDMVHHFRN